MKALMRSASRGDRRRLAQWWHHGSVVPKHIAKAWATSVVLAFLAGALLAPLAGAAALAGLILASVGS